MHGKTESFYYYLPVILAGTVPWSVYLIKVWKNKVIRESFFRIDENKLLIVWLLFILLFYTFSSSKLPTYIAPLFLPMAVFAGSILKKFEDDGQPGNSGTKKILYRFALFSQSLIIIILLILPLILKKYSDPEKGLVILISESWWIYIFLPVIVLVLMIFLPDFIFRKFRKGWFLTIYLLSALFLGTLLFPLNNFLAPYRSARVARDAISRYLPAGQDLYQYRINFYGIDFYNKIRTPVVEDFGELLEGIAKLAPEEKKRYFLSVNDFFALCSQKKEIYCITQHRERLKQIQTKVPAATVLWDNGAFYLLRIRN
jgi:4-amino-4-deoxy-L-arabinose transferase-like glycosyltransferase